MRWKTKENLDDLVDKARLNAAAKSVKQLLKKQRDDQIQECLHNLTLNGTAVKSQK